MMSKTNEMTTLECLAQNRLGALDRILGALTHRGILPKRMETFIDETTNTVRFRAEFHCTDDKMLDKLVKFLEKQVYVLNAAAAMPTTLTPINELSVA